MTVTVRTSIASVVSGEYDVLAGKVTLEVKVGSAGLAVIELDTRQAREMQLILGELLGRPLGEGQAPDPEPAICRPVIGRLAWDVARHDGTISASTQFFESLGWLTAVDDAAADDGESAAPAAGTVVPPAPKAPPVRPDTSDHRWGWTRRKP